MKYQFPLAFAINSFAMTGFMVVLGLLGKSTLAADFGIVHGATLALFYAFSANARNLILNPSSKVSIRPFFLSRIFLILPLGTLAFYLSVNLAGVDWLLALILIIRRCTEWISELHLSKKESHRDYSFAATFFATQSILFVFALFWSLVFVPFFWVGILFWAILPLVLHLGFIRETLSAEGQFRFKEAREYLFPHFGSTAIMGITVYVFRLSIVLLIGKTIAGDLFTAFALGGGMGSIFANALGPSLVHQERLIEKHLLPTWLKASLYFFCAFGIFLFVAAEINFEILSLLGKSFFFWSATGLSLIGGSIMVLAQRTRIALLQLHGDQDVFGPDLIINLIIIASVPFSFYIVGWDAFKLLFLFNAIVAFFFYSSARRGILTDGQEHRSIIPEKYTKFAIAVVLVFPLFFQLSGNIFNDPSYIFDSGGLLFRVPIPISVFACFGGLFLIGHYKRSKLSIYLVFLTFLFMLATTIISAKDHHASIGRDKLILMMQFILPMFALVLGQMYENKNENSKIFEKATFFVLLTIIPCQLISTLGKTTPVLSPYLYWFSIYQHLQYVATMFVCLYLIALFSLWGDKGYRKILIFFGPLMGFYAVLSASIFTNFILYFGLLMFVMFCWHKRSDKYKLFKDKSLVLLALLTIFLAGISYNVVRTDIFFAHKFAFLKPKEVKKIDKNMLNVSCRLKYWKYHINGVSGDLKKLLFGNVKRPKREIYPSAHNYYLDLVYNFGILSLIPMLGILIITIKKIYYLRKKIISKPEMIGLVLVVIFLLLVDNFLKVGLRQPYPGIITFFLWGMLLSRLSFVRQKC